ncbi:MAG: type IV pilin protein [Gammaproteobacteria bacterium]
MSGMTLIELMIVVLIVGILAGVGYPAYIDYVDRARRADGKALLMDAAARMERYYFDRNRYTTDLSELGYGAGTVTSAEDNYTLAAAACSGGTIATCYLLTATPNSGTFDDSDKCGNLTLDSRGAQGRSGSGYTVDQCWGR